MTHAPILGVLFDLDGTLVDTAPDLGSAANYVRHSTGLAPLPLTDYRSVASGGARGLLGKALGIAPEHPDFERHRDAFLTRYREHIAVHSGLFDGMEALLQTLETQGQRWGIVTNKPHWLTEPLAQALALTERAACVVSADQAARAKPAPDSLLLACNQTGLTPAQCLYVGDDVRDIEAGRAAGMRTVAAAWGYIGPTPIADWQADLVFDTPLAMRDWLLTA